MLLPSVPLFLLSWIADAQSRLRHDRISDDIIRTAIEMLLWCLLASAVLSLVMGLLLEKWRHGAIESSARAVFYMLSIFLTNCLIAFAGCGVTASLFQ